MPAPSLKIPVSIDLEKFKQQMQQTSSLAGTATRQIAKQFLAMNEEIGKSVAGAAAKTALGLATSVALVVGSLKLMTAAIGEARDQLKQMVDIADKAQNAGVSPQFFQAFTAESRKLKVEAGELEAALGHAFNATKDKSPIDVGEWTVGEEKITEVEKSLRVYNETLAKSAGQRLQGLVLFRDATTQDEKIKAVLAAMIQLDQVGQHAASLDLGERMFGTQLVDRIRQGRTSAEGMLSTIRETATNSDGIFSNVLVQRAKEMDDQLKLAHQRLSTALKPSWDDLASVLLTIKGTWSDTVNLIAKAVELSNKIKIPGFTSDTDIDAKRDALGKVNARLNGTSSWTDTYGILASRETLEGHRDRLQNEIGALAQGDQFGPPAPSQTRGTGAAPKKIKTDSEHDRFDTSADAIEKRTAALSEEAAGLDLSTAAREKNKIAASLQVVAMQANQAAGKGEGVVTAEQRKRIEEVTEAYSKATEAIEKATIAQSISRGRQTALLDPADVQIAEQLKGIYPDVATALKSVEASAMRTNEAMRSVGSTMSSSLTTGLADILDGTKSVSAGFASMAKSIVRSIEEAAIKMAIVQPLMRSFGGMLGGGATMVSDLGAGTGGLAYPQFADGGPVTGPGGPRDDKVLARLSHGEFVVNAASTAKHRAMLEAINRGAPRFADGGIVGGGSSAPMLSGNQTHIAPQIAVTVQGSPGQSAQDHQRMGENIAQAAQVHIQEMIGKELRNQRRPGGILR